VLKRCPEVGVSVEADGAHATFACRTGTAELDFLKPRRRRGKPAKRRSSDRPDPR
jgi:hypothetical protein